MLYDIPCIIFAGGKSSRMGVDKALLPFASFDTLTEFQYLRLEKKFKKVYISCKDKSKFDFEANFIEDSHSSDISAPTLAFNAILNKIQVERFFVMSVDTPFIDFEIIDSIVKADRQGNDATVAKLGSTIQPLIGIYHNSLKSEFEEMITNNNHKLGKLLERINTHYVSFSNEKSFINLNHPSEYQKALTLI